MPPPPSYYLTSMINSVFGHHPYGEATVVQVKHTVYAIGWLALNQSVSLDLFEADVLIPPFSKLDPKLLENRMRPKQFWFGKDVGGLTLLRTPSDAQMHCGDHLRLKDNSQVPVTVHGQEGFGHGPVTVDMCVVMETQTEVDILWQDGTKETVSAIDVIPHTPDEYDCWSVFLC